MTPLSTNSRTEAAAADPERRSFMGLTLIAPAAAAGSLLGLASLPPAVQAMPVPEPAAPPRGYHRSEHTDSYYASLRY